MYAIATDELLWRNQCASHMGVMIPRQCFSLEKLLYGTNDILQMRKEGAAGKKMTLSRRAAFFSWKNIFQHYTVSRKSFFSFCYQYRRLPHMHSHGITSIVMFKNHIITAGWGKIMNISFL
jgi:hypothetical protein